MLSKVIERSADQHFAESFRLDRVDHFYEPTPASESPDTGALTRRIEQLEQTLAQTEAAAYARGRREAETEGTKRYSATMQATAEKLAQSVKQLADLRPHLCQEAEADLLRLAIAIAKRILHRELTVDPMALQALVKVCLDRLGRQEQIRVRVSPILADAVRSILTKLSSRAIDVGSDSSLEAGALIFETNRGQLDASIHSQLAEIERGLIDCLENRAS
jgi:flagellar assembly protein FliH